MTVCVGCGCTDTQACPGGCTWLIVDEDAGEGACSRCPEVLDEFICPMCLTDHIEGDGCSWTCLECSHEWRTQESFRGARRP